MSGTVELQRLAANYAREATQQDRDGFKDLAVVNYQRAVEILTALKNLGSDDVVSEIYEDRIQRYTKRIQELATRHEAKKISIEDGMDLPWLVKRKPNVSWDDVVLSEGTRTAIEESITLRIKRPDLFKLSGVRGILLFGPPGCGKTLVSAAIAREAEAHFFSIDSASIMSKWLGESEKNLASVFREAKSLATAERPSIIFIDEVDTLAGVKNSEVGGEVRTRNQLLNEMDNVLDKNQRIYLYVIGATNKPWALDEPFLRRFQKRIFLDLPDKKARLKLIQILSKQLSLNADMDPEELAATLRGYSPSDIRDVFEAVESKLARELVESQQRSLNGKTLRAAGREDFEEVIRNRKPSVSEPAMSYYKRWAGSFGAL